MNRELNTIKTETLNAVAKEVRELETRLAEIFDEYGGINIRSITKLIHEFNTQIEVNGDLYWEGKKLYADCKEFRWDGSPNNVESLRLLEYGHISYIYIAPKSADHPNYIDCFDIGFEEDGDQWGNGVNVPYLVYELNERVNMTEFLTDLGNRVVNFHGIAALNGEPEMVGDDEAARAKYIKDNAEFIYKVMCPIFEHIKCNLADEIIDMVSEKLHEHYGDPQNRK
jgi:hypothetical protein